MAVLFEKTKLLTDKQFHYCPGCNHGIIHRLVAEVIDEMNLDGKVIGVSQGATTQGLIEQMIKDNGFHCEPEFRAFSGYPIIKSSLDAGNIDVFAMDRSTLAGYMNETVELLQPEVKFGEQGYGVATKKGCDLSAVVDRVICDRLADGWLDQEVKTWGLV